jgi:hypothetical protein
MKPLDQFYVRKKRGTAGIYCKPCTYERTIERQRRIKQEAVAYKGARCLHCGYSKYVGCLEFHHRDPKEKDFPISSIKHSSFERLKPELDNKAGS